MRRRIGATFARMAENKPMIVHDDPSVTEVFCSRHVSTVYEDGVYVVTLGTPRFVPETMQPSPEENKKATVRVTTRIALSEKAARGLLHSLGSMLATKRGTVQ